MYTARIVVLIIALGAGGVAACLASGVDIKPPAPVQPVAQLETADVNAVETTISQAQGGGVNVIRYGVASRAASQK